MSSAHSRPTRRVGILLGIVGVITAIAVGIVFFVINARSPIREAARLARESLAARQFDEARKRIDAWAALDPRSSEPAYDRAVLEVEANRPAEALDAMRKAISQGHPEEPVLVLRAVVMARAGKFDEAEPVLARAFQSGVEPKAEVAEGLSRIYLKTYRLPETARVLDSWMKAAPDDPRPYLLRNEVDERMHAEPSVLVRNYREALRRDPSLIKAQIGLAEKLQEGSQIDDAETEYARLLELDPRNVPGLVGAGRIALLKGDLMAATRHFEGALAIDPREKVALRESGLIDMHLGRVDQARTKLKVAVEVDPFDPEIRYSYARVLKMAGDDLRAAEETATTERLKAEQKKIIDLRQSLVERPDDTQLRTDAAKWLIEHGHDKEGLEWTALILRQKPDHGPTCRLLADYYASHGNVGLANYYRMNASAPVSGP